MCTNSDVASICPGDSLVQKADLHHPPFECTLNFFVPNVIDQPKNLSIYSSNNCNYTDISNFLVNIDFEQNLLNIPLENSLKKFYEIINHSFTTFIPKITINENYSPLWAKKTLKI